MLYTKIFAQTHSGWPNFLVSEFFVTAHIILIISVESYNTLSNVYVTIFRSTNYVNTFSLFRNKKRTWNRFRTPVKTVKNRNRSIFRINFWSLNKTEIIENRQSKSKMFNSVFSTMTDVRINVVTTIPHGTWSQKHYFLVSFIWR